MWNCCLARLAHERDIPWVDSPHDADSSDWQPCVPTGQVSHLKLLQSENVSHGENMERTQPVSKWGKAE